MDTRLLYVIADIASSDMPFEKALGNIVDLELPQVGSKLRRLYEGIQRRGLSDVGVWEEAGIPARYAKLIIAMQAVQNMELKLALIQALRQMVDVESTVRTAEGGAKAMILGMTALGFFFMKVIAKTVYNSYKAVAAYSSMDPIDKLPPGIKQFAQVILKVHQIPWPVWIVIASIATIFLFALSLIVLLPIVENMQAEGMRNLHTYRFLVALLGEKVLVGRDDLAVEHAAEEAPSQLREYINEFLRGIKNQAPNLTKASLRQLTQYNIRLYSVLHPFLRGEIPIDVLTASVRTQGQMMQLIYVPQIAGAMKSAGTLISLIVLAFTAIFPYFTTTFISLTALK